MQRREFNQLLNTILTPDSIQDFCPNGLQVEGREQIKKIVTGVTASQALIDAAIAHSADTILVHHGYFWKGEAQPITGMKKRRIAALLNHDINLFAYHLPLDVHPTIGNNAQLAQLLDLEMMSGLEPNTRSVAVTGRLKTPMSGKHFAQKIATALNREPLVSLVRDEPIETIAWCTGGGQGYIDLAASQGIDAYLTGEASEQTIHSSREQKIDFFAAGHHATERYGIKALGELLAEQHGFDVTFIDIDNPV
ncbi:Nif3-like dinuclear metal center hexameric protein [Pseudoalteromonas arctica]|uniref:GTP cyclohydrolase 1 type 2 homolog n=1 Tax=Pseudoalteromonas arctica TaxID=394751 RepID=A0A7Y0DRE9_9GAMM|nr:Nif3-like dinuclear metal center hexameric protein [Pseudoalteromonas arctica]NMM40272.1 Nif3-like dinuclear metal center hexameric protein [Pseudoalteromonas arctica]